MKSSSALFRSSLGNPPLFDAWPITTPETSRRPLARALQGGRRPEPANETELSTPMDRECSPATMTSRTRFSNRQPVKAVGGVDVSILDSIGHGMHLLTTYR